MKKVVIVSSSPRQGNSDALADEFLKGAKASGHDVVKINLREKNIIHCQACCDCYNIGHCVQGDDMNSLYDDIKSADVLVFATPIYFGSISGQLKTFLDRLYPIYQNLKAKQSYIIASCYQDDINFINQSVFDIRRFLEDAGGIPISGIVYGQNTDEPRDITEKQLKNAFNVGKQIE